MISNANYDGNPTQNTYAQGDEVRLIDGEIEVRIINTYPAYALIVRSQQADIKHGEWYHVVVDMGTAKKAEEIRIYLDGREVATEAIHDGMLGKRTTTRKKPFRIGADHSLDVGASFLGLIDEVRMYSESLTHEQIKSLVRADAISFARSQSESLNATQKTWLVEAALSASQPDYFRLSQDRDAKWSTYLALKRSAPTTMVMRETPNPRPAYILERGVYDAHGQEVTADAPTFIAEWPDNAPRNRLGLAEWLTHPRQPLTARVVVNRFWAQLFGTGIVKTLEDFGSQGEYPSHPELLDWMAIRFVDSGWNVKALMKEIVMSATYRQSSVVTPNSLRIDPENRLLSRAPRLRLPAEFLRDQALALSGLLRSKIGGPSVYPTQPQDLYKGIVVGPEEPYPGTFWPTSEGDDLYRRSLYTFWKRTVLHPAMSTFDTPDREICVARRSRTNTPLQALVMMNEPGYAKAAQAFGKRIRDEGGTTVDDQLGWAFRVATAREASEAERRVLKQAFDDQPESIDEAYANAASILLNLDELISRE